MQKATKKEQHEALKALKDSNRSFKQAKIKRYLLSLFVIICAITLFKVVIGTISIKALFYHNGFSLQINDNPIGITTKQELSRDFIPFLIRYHNVYENKFFPGTNFKDVYEIEKKNTYILKIETYECIYEGDGNKTNCENDKTRQIEILNVKYDLKITKDNEIIYDGIFIEDITPYIKEGKYNLIISNKSNYITTTIKASIIIN